MSEQPTSIKPESETESQLSAFVDDELSRDEAHFLTRRLGGDAAMQKRLHQYHLIGSVVRGERRVAESLESRIRAELATLPPQSIDQGRVFADERPRRSSQWSRVLGGGAIAAGVAALSLFVLNQSIDTNPSGIVDAAGVTSTYTVPEYEQGQTAQPQISLREPQLVNYMLRHGQIATPLMIESDLPDSATTDVVDDETESVVDEFVSDR
ncbi:MAG: sigma-E factor negative regulatory protein [Pseudomonadota bacterium]